VADRNGHYVDGYERLLNRGELDHRKADCQEHPQTAHCGLWQTVSSRSIADVRSETQLAKLDKVLDMKVEDVSVLAPLMPPA